MLGAGKQMLTECMYYQSQTGIMSLFEALCMRALIHQHTGYSLIPGKDLMAALRTELTLLDASYGYEPVAIHDKNAFIYYQFIDSSIQISDVRSELVSPDTAKQCMQAAAQHFCCTEQPHKEKRILQTMSLSKFFVTADKHHLLNYKIVSGKVTVMLKSRGVSPRDTFCCF